MNIQLEPFSPFFCWANLMHHCLFNQTHLDPNIHAQTVEKGFDIISASIVFLFVMSSAGVKTTLIMRHVLSDWPTKKCHHLRSLSRLASCFYLASSLNKFIFPLTGIYILPKMGTKPSSQQPVSIFDVLWNNQDPLAMSASNFPSKVPLHKYEKRF